jgi:hypothetical protein
VEITFVKSPSYGLYVLADSGGFVEVLFICDDNGSSAGLFVRTLIVMVLFVLE